MIAFEPIGHYRGAEDSPALAPRQGTFAPDRPGRIELLPSLDPLVLRDLGGFTKIWILFHFDQARGWHPLVLPPHRKIKRGVFATRSPYRPNAIGMTAVDLVGLEGRTLRVRGGDLLDGTPVLDIKPYLPYADAFPDAATGWVAEDALVNPVHDVVFSPEAGRRVAWLESACGKAVRDLVVDQLQISPTLHKSKRVKATPGAAGPWCFSWRTWRFFFRVDSLTVTVLAVESGIGPGATSGVSGGYTEAEWAVHQDFLTAFP